MRSWVALAGMLALAGYVLLALAAQATENAGRADQKGPRPSSIAIQPNIGTPQKPDYALFSPDKRVLATSDSKRIRIWDIATGRLLRTLEHYAYNTGIVFAPDGQSIWAAYKDGALRAWDLQTGAMTATIQVVAASEEEGVSSLAIDEKGQVLLAGAQNGVIAGFALSSQKQLFSLEFGEEPNLRCEIAALGLSQDGEQVIAISRFCGVKWFSLKTNAISRLFKLPVPQSGDVQYIGYLGGGLALAQTSSGCGAEVSLLDLSREQVEKVEILPAATSCPGERADAGEPWVVVQAASNSIFVGRTGIDGFDVRNLKTRSAVRRLNWPGAGAVAAVSLDLELAAVSDGSVIQVRDLRTGEAVQKLSAQGYEAATAFMSADGQTINLMKVSAAGQKLVTMGVGAATPFFLSRKPAKNTYYFSLSSALGRIAALEKNSDENALSLSVINVADEREILKFPLNESEGVLDCQDVAGWKPRTPDRRNGPPDRRRLGPRASPFQRRAVKGGRLRGPSLVGGILAGWKDSRLELVQRR